MESRFKNENAMVKRTLDAQRVLYKYPDRIPVIIECADPKLQPLKSPKYLVPKDLTVGQLLYILRRQIKLEHTQAIFLFVRNTLPPVSSLMADMYGTYRDVDGFLYMQYRSENTFG